MKSPSPATSAPTNSAARDPRWAAVPARDPAADAHFVYAVKTTGIYCRPSSPWRLPRPENVEFFATAAAAEAAGYRPSRHTAASARSRWATTRTRWRAPCRTNSRAPP